MRSHGFHRALLSSRRAWHADGTSQREMGQTVYTRRHSPPHRYIGSPGLLRPEPAAWPAPGIVVSRDGEWILWGRVPREPTPRAGTNAQFFARVR
jgi:hypothetical protein